MPSRLFGRVSGCIERRSLKVGFVKTAQPDASVAHRHHIYGKRREGGGRKRRFADGSMDRVSAALKSDLHQNTPQSSHMLRKQSVRINGQELTLSHAEKI
jgi:hypothetical protein